MINKNKLQKKLEEFIEEYLESTNIAIGENTVTFDELIETNDNEFSTRVLSREIVDEVLVSFMNEMQYDFRRVGGFGKSACKECDHVGGEWVSLHNQPISENELHGFHIFVPR